MFLKQSTARNLSVFMTSSTDHISGKTGLSAGLTIYLSKDGGAPASITPTITELDATNMPGWYSLALTTTHTNTLGDFALHVTGTGADPADLVRQVVLLLPGDAVSLQADQAVNVTKVNGTVQTAGDLGASAAAIKAKTDSLTFTVSNVLDANVVDWKGSSAPANTGDAFARLGAPAGGSVSADVAAVKSEEDAIKAKTDNLPASPADETLVIAATNAIAALIGAPAVTLAADIATRLAASSYTAPDNSDISAIKAKTDNLPASPAAVGDAMTLTSAYDFAKGTVVMAEAYAADGSAPTPAQMLFMLWALLAERSISGVTLTAKKLDGATSAMTFTLDDPTNPSSQTRAT